MEEKNNIIINQVDPSTFEYQQYTDKDNALIASSKLDTTFTSSIDYIEYYAYGEDQSLIFPAPGDNVYQNKNYKVIDGDVLIYPSQDLEDLGYEEGSFFSTYNFYRKRLGSSPEVNYYIDEISGDRTELRLKSNVIENNIIVTSSLDFIQYRTDAEYFADFLLNFGSDQQVICNNIDLDNTDDDNPSVLVKLYDPLPETFELKDEFWVVEEISSPQAYNVVFPEIEFIPNDFQLISGPNYSIQITQQSGEASQGDSVFGTTNVESTAPQGSSVNVSEDDDGYCSFDVSAGAEEFLNEFGGNAIKSPFQDGHYIYTVIAGGGSGQSSYSPILYVADLESPANFKKKLQP